MKIERLPYAKAPKLPYRGCADPLELWLACKDPSTVSIEVVIVHKKRDLDPQYEQSDSDAAKARNAKVQEATRDMILDQCSTPVDWASIQDGAEVISTARMPFLFRSFHGVDVEDGCCFTVVKHLKNPRWKWVEAVADVVEMDHSLVYEREARSTGVAK